MVARVGVVWATSKLMESWQTEISMAFLQDRSFIGRDEVSTDDDSCKANLAIVVCEHPWQSCYGFSPVGARMVWVVRLWLNHFDSTTPLFPTTSNVPELPCRRSFCRHLSGHHYDSSWILIAQIFWTCPLVIIKLVKFLRIHQTKSNLSTFLVLEAYVPPSYLLLGIIIILRFFSRPHPLHRCGHRETINNIQQSKYSLLFPPLLQRSECPSSLYWWSQCACDY